MRHKEKSFILQRIGINIFNTNEIRICGEMTWNFGFFSLCCNLSYIIRNWSIDYSLKYQ